MMRTFHPLAIVICWILVKYGNVNQALERTFHHDEDDECQDDLDELPPRRWSFVEFVLSGLRQGAGKLWGCNAEGVAISDITNAQDLGLSFCKADCLRQDPQALLYCLVQVVERRTVWQGKQRSLTWVTPVDDFDAHALYPPRDPY